ncbi:hypothetical protein U0070_001266, partial [Myodes glareolus]
MSIWHHLHCSDEVQHTWWKPSSTGNRSKVCILVLLVLVIGEKRKQSTCYPMYLVGGLREQNLNWVEITQFSSRNPKSIAGRAVQWAIRIDCPGARL